MPESRVLTVAFVPGVTPGKWIRRWEERMPQCPLLASPVSEVDQVAILHRGETEMSFVRLPVDRAGLNVIELYAEIPVVVAPKDHEIAVFDEVPVAELAAEYLLQDPDLFPEWRDISDQIRAGTRPPLPAMETLEAALDLVEAGLGILILPMSVARQFSRKSLRARPVSGVPQPRIGLAWLEGNTDPVIEEFIGVVRGRSAQSSRQPSVQAAQDAAPKKVRGGSGAGKDGGKGASRVPAKSSGKGSDKSTTTAGGTTNHGTRSAGKGAKTAGVKSKGHASKRGRR
ncbi:LysR family substrate-binding domain-containing protein [Arthrobacter terrae]|uniref:LysR family substrate-binding domain-containing protein n=1 Tax=Arthrobacter terrae TaxID=2935737 RepID=UPI0028B0CC06|nr:LysR family substrate-binding domain-containing protein [Arthrobacter terrae]